MSEMIGKRISAVSNFTPCSRLRSPDGRWATPATPGCKGRPRRGERTGEGNTIRTKSNIPGLLSAKSCPSFNVFCTF